MRSSVMPKTRRRSGRLIEQEQRTPLLQSREMPNDEEDDGDEDPEDVVPLLPIFSAPHLGMLLS